MLSGNALAFHFKNVTQVRYPVSACEMVCGHLVVQVDFLWIYIALHVYGFVKS